MLKNLFLFFLLLASFAAANAQTTVFTYQGRLTDAAAQANGTYDLGFALFDQASGGTQIGAAQTRAAVNVSNGVFTVQLDFGAAAFPGANRYLEIAVKKTSEANFTTLAPRQLVTSTPYAIRALNATNADTATTATTATNAQQLSGVAAANYLQTSGSGANLTNLNASNVASGTLDDARLSSNVALRNSANTFTGNQTINGNLTQIGATTDLNLTNGFVSRGAFGAGSIPATGAGARMMFYPGKAAFRAGRVFDDTASSGYDGSAFWNEANVGGGSVAFGANNRASGANSFAAGLSTTASGNQSVALGSYSTASGEKSFAFNGTASAPEAIALGNGAQATSDSALALGASSNAIGAGSIAIGASYVKGTFATAIGLQNSAFGNFSTVIGRHVTDCAARGCTSFFSGVIALGDNSVGFTSEEMYATANNQFNVRAAGGIRFFSSCCAYNAGVSLAPGAGAWSSISDRNMKENFQAVNARDVLHKVLKLPISTWNYKTQDASIRHIGAMAQEFKAAFAVGEDDKHISTIDPDGVAFAAIQGLNEEMRDELKKRDERIERQQKQIDELKAIVCAIKSDAAVCKIEDK